MIDAWNFALEPASGGMNPGSVTLLDGTTFCISNTVGDIDSGGSHGLFVADTRFLAIWRLRVNGAVPAPLSVIESDPAGGSFVTRLRPTPIVPNPALLVTRDRYVGEGMSELLTLRNLARDSIDLRLSIDVGADFAHLFEVKEDRLSPRGFHSVEVVRQEMVFDFRDGHRRRRLSVSVPPEAEAGPGQMTFVVQLGPNGSWSVPFEFTIRVDDVELAPRHVEGRPGPSASAAGYRVWHAAMPRFASGDESFTRALSRSVADVGSLRISDEELDRDAIIAAGAPWYMAMFGRDSLITSQMCLLLDPSMASGTLRALASHQGQRVDTTTEEQPGRILHELRFRIDGGTEGPSRSAYYGSIDSTPLFVCLLGEAARFGLGEEELLALLPAADLALGWVSEYGDRDGDQFVEYERLSSQGLVNQGWKDSTDSIAFADGTLAHTPIALCEVQGYTYAAWRAREDIAVHLGDQETADRCNEKATQLKQAFNERFFVAESGCFALALDGAKRQVDAVASNIGHLLWTGVVDDEHASRVAEHLISPELFSGWGVRTLSSKMAAYNPMSYHNGSVWPHDTAICVAGLTRYGFYDEAATIGLGLIAAAETFGGRLPELFCGFSHEEFAAPVAYPAACSPQAWAAASLISLVRSFIGLDPDVPDATVRLQPAVPDLLDKLTIRGLMLAGNRVDVDASGAHARLEGLAPGLRIEHVQRERSR
ncbi:MAG TPA: glycogen debranching N-terminal domain-containing protein [Acidimicrobiales bacterium]